MRGSGAERRWNSHEKEKTHTPEEIIKKLREAEGLIAAGKGVEDAPEAIRGRPDARQGDLEGNRGGKMVGPARRREALVHLRQSLDVSERRACRATKQPRSTQRYRLKRLDKDKELLEEILRLPAKEKRAGYRTAWRHLRRNGWEVNPKRVHRIWKREGLRLPLKSHKRRRLEGADQGTQRLGTNRRNHVWSYDFVFDQTERSRPRRGLARSSLGAGQCSFLLGCDKTHPTKTHT
jgi:hypothetical protein